MLLLTLAGCWKVHEDLNPIDMSEVPYENPYLDTEATVQMLDVDLLCPDGDPMRLFSVYTPGAGESPVAIVLHSGPFDYVKVRDEGVDDVLAGEHYHLDSRLARTWGNDKVWETLGLAHEEVDPPEINFGTLPAALANAGFIQLYPTNCWGDLWHGEAGIQEGDTDLDGFSRNGLGAAWRTVEMLTDADIADDANFEVPVPWNGELYLIGLGEGGRGVAELLMHDDMPEVAGILVDSSPDDLTPYVDDPILWADEVTGLERIFGNEPVETNTLDTWSLLAVADAGLLPDRVGYLWSSLDPRIPNAAMDGFAAVAGPNPASWVVNLGIERHVLTNADEVLANQVTDFLLTGTVPN